MSDQPTGKSDLAMVTFVLIMLAISIYCGYVRIAALEEAVEKIDARVVTLMNAAQ